MSERYRVRDLKRAAAKLWADPSYGPQLELRRQEEIASRLRLRSRSQVVVGGTPRVVECRHGVAWLCCNLCSKPRGH